MGEMESTSPPPRAGGAVLQVVFMDGERSVDLGTVTVQPSLGMRKLQAVVADHVGVAPQQISASLARPRRQRRVPLDEGADLAAVVAREGAGCYVLAGLRRSRRDRRGGRSRRDRKGAGAGAGSQPLLMAPSSERTIQSRGGDASGCCSCAELLLLRARQRAGEQLRQAAATASSCCCCGRGVSPFPKSTEAPLSLA